ncbi:DUF2062 domain-containing protein [Qipengyuania sp.]|uniref:DUF2062 domain-containing protein n=1 Tax=Qipengyuania sp. TaxID=2004515 RepID=UPI0035C8072F
MRKPESKSRSRKRFVPSMPTREELAENKYLAPIAHRFLSPELWRFTRRSVPRGVALGLFAGFIVPLGQVFLAAFLALPARANVPLAALTTFVTNPLTLPFWLIAANRVGAFMLDIESPVMSQAAGDLASNSGVLAGWFETAGITAFGFVVLAILSSAIGYLVASAVWRLVVGRKRRRRVAAAHLRRAAQQQQQQQGELR